MEKILKLRTCALMTYVFGRNVDVSGLKTEQTLKIMFESGNCFQKQNGDVLKLTTVLI